MSDPFRAKGSQPNVRYERGGQWPTEYLFERLGLLGFNPVQAMEDLIVAFGDPDADPSAAEVFAASDSELRRLVKIARGDDPDEVKRAAIDTNESTFPDDGELFDPAWTIPQLLDFVGESKERAADVLTAEDTSEHPRSTLVAALRRILDDG